MASLKRFNTACYPPDVQVHAGPCAYCTYCGLGWRFSSVGGAQRRSVFWGLRRHGLSASAIPGLQRCTTASLEEDLAKAI